MAAGEVLMRGNYTMPMQEYIDSFPVGFPTNAGVNVNATSAEKFSAVFACVRTYEWVMASLPLRITSKKNEEITEVKNGELHDLLYYPNKYLNAFSFMSLMNARLQLYGNAVAVIIFNTRGIPVEFIPVSWTCVNMKLSNGQPVYMIDDPEVGIKGTYLFWEVIHFKINLRNPWVGRSPITVAREAIGLGMAAENFGSDFFKKGGNLKGVLETEQSIPDNAFKDWLKRWTKNYEGSKGDHKTPLLEYGMKYKMLGVPPNDAQFIETRVHQVQDIARYFGPPPSIIGENSRNTFLNGEQQDIQFGKYCISPLCKMEESELESKLMDRKSQEKFDIRFDLDYLLRGDMLTRARSEQILVSSGIFTRNEARKLENKTPLAGLDEPLNPAFLTGKTEATGNGQPATGEEDPDKNYKPTK
jgi:HK97 family phage portal protein